MLALEDTLGVAYGERWDLKNDVRSACGASVCLCVSCVCASVCVRAFFLIKLSLSLSLSLSLRIKLGQDLATEHVECITLLKQLWRPQGHGGRDQRVHPCAVEAYPHYLQAPEDMCGVSVGVHACGGEEWEKGLRIERQLVV